MHAQILKYFWVVTLLFLTGAAVLSARLTSVFLARQLSVGDVETGPAVAQRPAPVRRESLSDYMRDILNQTP